MGRQEVVCAGSEVKRWGCGHPWEAAWQRQDAGIPVGTLVMERLGRAIGLRPHSVWGGHTGLSSRTPAPLGFRVLP